MTTAAEKSAAVECQKSGIPPLFRVFPVFCLLHPLPGGKTRKVRKPMGFIRFDAHVVKAGINLMGRREIGGR